MVDMPLKQTRPNHIYIYAIYMYKEGLVLNKLQSFSCHKIQLNQITYLQYICIKKIWHLITYNGWYAIKPNQTNQSALYIV